MHAPGRSGCPDVESVPDRARGALVVRDTGRPVASVLETLDAPGTEDAMAQCEVTRAPVVAVLDVVVRRLHASEPDAV